MNRKFRIGAIVVGVFILVLLILPALVDVNTFRPKIESELSASLGRQVKIGNLSLSIFSGSVGADAISISDDPTFGADPFITAKSFKAGVNVMPLIFSKTLHITEIALEEPQISLLRTADGKWNFSSLGGGSGASAAAPGTPSDKSLVVDKISVDDGRLSIGTANSADKPSVYEKVNVEATNFSATTQFPFKLSATLPGGGDFSLKGKCGPIPAGNTLATPLESTLQINKLDLAASGFVSPSSGIQGIIDFDGTTNSDGQQAKTMGTLQIDKLKLAAKGAPSKPTVKVKYGVDFNLKAQAGALTQGEVAIGKAIARLTGTYQTQAQTIALNLKLDGDNMPMDELVGALPALGVVFPSGSRPAGGTLTTDFAIAGTSDNPVVTGSIRLSNVTLVGLDMGSKLSAIPAFSGKGGGKDTTIQNLSANVRAAPEGTQVNGINVSIPSLGVVTGAGSISPSGALSFKMIADLAGAEGTRAGKGKGVPFGIEGTTSDPKFTPDIKGIAGAAISSKVSEKRPEGVRKKRR